MSVVSASTAASASASATAASAGVATLAVVHPLVLLSAVDHFNRVAKDTKRRVVGVLLGSTLRGRVDITNSFAVPFEEDEKNSDIWFFDGMYVESLFAMFRKVNIKENIVGWYSSGPKIRPNDIQINEMMRKYVANPVFVVIDVRPSEQLGLPTKAYVALSEVSEDGSAVNSGKMLFRHVASEIGALEAEEVGVEHLLRDVNDESVSTLASKVRGKLLSLKSLVLKLKEIHEYLDDVIAGKLPINHEITKRLQDVFNSQTDLCNDETLRALAVKTNDMSLSMYLASLIRSVIAMHTLINNKIDNNERERLEALEEANPGAAAREKAAAEKTAAEKAAAEKGSKKAGAKK